MGPGQPGHPPRGSELTLTDIEAHVLDLTRQGLTNASIAARTGYSIRGVQKIRRRGIRRYLKENGADEVRATQSMVMEALVEGAFPAVFTVSEGEDGKQHVHVNEKVGSMIIAASRHLANMNGAVMDGKMALARAIEERTRNSSEPAVIDAVTRFMELADGLAQSGYGSGRVETVPAGEIEAPKDTADKDDQVVDAEVVSS